MRAITGLTIQQRLLTSAAAVVCVMQASPAMAQERSFDVAAGPASQTIPTFARQAGVQILASGDIVKGKTTRRIKGRYSVEEALRKLLAGTNLKASPVANGIITIGAVPEASANGTDSASSGRGDAIVVTGTRIKGGSPASPLIILDSQDIHDAGQQSLGEVVRSLPVSYGGGENPGVRHQTGDISNDNTSGGSSINLRGLGPDATLTLLNGHRLSYNGNSQAVDISVIPIDAVSSIQIVPDGASAIYGSDAVAGVANVILKRDYSGLATTARIGGATSGGGFQQAYDAVSGGRWNDGGLLIAYNYGRQSAIRSNQRDYTKYLAEPSTLIDSESHHSVLLTAHQDISSALNFNIDGIYNHRSVTGAQNSSSTYSFEYANPSTRWAISPTLQAYLSSDWTLQVNGFIGGDKSNNSAMLKLKPSGKAFYELTTKYENRSQGFELNAEGSVFRISGEEARLAIGAGYRMNKFSQTFSTNTIAYSGSIDSSYGYGEITVPVVSEYNSRPFLHRLTLSGAYRYEDYDSFGGVGTPKLGIIYSPADQISVKLSWGKSFKAPTLLQQFKEYQANLYTAASLGGVGLPSSATVLVPFGGNPDLKPERAQTWSATVDARPEQIPGLTLQITYFDVKYRDRVVQPLLPISATLSNRVFSEFLTYDPTPAQQAAIIQMAPRGIQNYTGAAYDPADVMAIANDIYINTARQNIHGVDLSSKYSFEAMGGKVNLSMRASWLSSSQQNSASSGEISLAGTQYNPPHWRGRAGASWSGQRVTLSAYYNYIGPVTDTSTTPAVSGRSMQNVDLNLFFRPAMGWKPLRGIEIGLIAQNLFNEQPPYLYPANNTVIDYDSTNYSPVGRFLALSVRKRW